MFGIGENDEGILQNAYLREWQMPDGLVLLSGDGHWWIALDYRRSGPAGPPSVGWYDNEAGEDVELADDFETFSAGASKRGCVRHRIGRRPSAQASFPNTGPGDASEQKGGGR